MTTSRTAVRRTLWAMAATIIIAVGGATLWSAAVPLDGALIAAGTVAVEGNVKKVQHTTGGIIAKINVVEGQQVTAGDVLVQLNDTSTRAILAIVSNELTALRDLRAEFSDHGLHAVDLALELGPARPPHQQGVDRCDGIDIIAGNFQLAKRCRPLSLETGDFLVQLLDPLSELLLLAIAGGGPRLE